MPTQRLFARRVVAAVVLLVALGVGAYAVDQRGSATDAPSAGADRAAAPSTAPPGDPGGSSGAGHAHGGPPTKTRPLTAQEARTRRAQLSQLTTHLPGTTVQAALDDGYVITNTLESKDNVHLTDVDQMTRPFDPARPAQILAEGRSGTDRLIAAVYWVDGPSPTAPEGFAGPQDQWHHHEGEVCQLPDPTQTTPPTKSACTAAGGTWVHYVGWMLHVWNLPGWENPAGMFAADNVCLTNPKGWDCADVGAQSTP